jgi:hypothetical protein
MRRKEIKCASSYLGDKAIQQSYVVLRRNRERQATNQRLKR